MTLAVRPLARTFAAELRGVDLRRPDAATLEQIYDAFLDYGVVVLPGQALSIDQHLAFAATFGELHVLPKRESGPARRIENRAIDDVSNLTASGEVAGAGSERVMFQMGNRLWHSDLSFQPNPAHASMLHALEIALDGGETQFADLRAAYDDLPPARKTALEGLIAEHDLAHSRIRGGYSGISLDEIRKLMPPSAQPVVRVHPETGAKSLFVGAHAARILGMDEAQGQALIDDLIGLATQPPYVYTHRWAVHDLVIWDNRRTMHRGLAFDADTERRVMHRATVSGDGPTIVEARIAPVDVARRRLRPLVAA